MKLNHFTTPEATLEYITDDLLFLLREELGGMLEMVGQGYTEQDCLC